jgi:hypothetical protein
VTTTHVSPVVDLRAYYSQDRRYTLEDLERLLPSPPVGDDEGSSERTYEGPFNPHHGESLPDDVQGRFRDYLKRLGLIRHSDGRYRGACPFLHEGAPVMGTHHFM